eukprot:2621398-Prymnesium_polylepis.1
MCIRDRHVFRTGLSTARRIGPRGMPGHAHQAGDPEPAPYVGRETPAQKGQGEIPGAEKSAPELSVIPGGHAKK